MGGGSRSRATAGRCALSLHDTPSGIPACRPADCSRCSQEAPHHPRSKAVNRKRKIWAAACGSGFIGGLILMASGHPGDPHEPNAPRIAWGVVIMLASVITARVPRHSLDDKPGRRSAPPLGQPAHARAASRHPQGQRADPPGTPGRHGHAGPEAGRARSWTTRRPRSWSSWCCGRGEDRSHRDHGISGDISKITGVRSTGTE